MASPPISFIKKDNMKKDLEIFQRNVFPAMLKQLASDFGMPEGTVEPFKLLGIGYYPGEMAWAIPEKDSKGEVIGISLRSYSSSDKWAVKGSKRGLIYVEDQIFSQSSAPRYTPGSQNWERVSRDYPCPICGGYDWCMVSAENPDDPGAVICPRTSEGSTKDCGSSGYLHILKQEYNYTEPPEAEILPLLIVEGFSDWCIAETLGFHSIGKANSKSPLGELVDRFGNRDVVIIGDNEPGGVESIERTFESLRDRCKSVTKVFPPDGIRDLRTWYCDKYLTAQDILDYVKSHGDSESDDGIIKNMAPMRLAERWLTDEHTQDGMPTLYNYKNQWVKFDEHKYVIKGEGKADHWIRGSLYNYLDGRRYWSHPVKGSPDIKEIDPNPTIVNGVIDALSAYCNIDRDPPVWLSDRGPVPGNYIVFKNGVLDVDEWVKGKVIMYPPSPNLFTLSAIPHNFNPDAKCPQTEETVLDIFQMDHQKDDLWWEYMGYGAFPSQLFQAILLLVGLPGAGKGVLMDLMAGMLGPDQCTAPSLDELGGRFGAYTLMGKLMAQLRDASMTRFSNSGNVLNLLKKVSGNDTVNLERKFNTAMENVRLFCRFILSVNEMPQFPDQAKALKRRLHMIHCTNCYIGRENRTLAQDLIKAEMEGIIAKSMIGLRRAITNGKLTFPESSDVLMKEFEALSSPVGSFMRECCTIGGGYQIPKQQMYDCYRRWCDCTGQRPNTMYQLGQRMMALKPSIMSKRKRVAGEWVESFVNISITPEAARTYLGEPT